MLDPKYTAIKARIVAFVSGQFEDAAAAFNKHPSAEHWAALDEAMWARQALLSVQAGELHRLWHDEPLGRYLATLAAWHQDKLPPSEKAALEYIKTGNAKPVA